MAQLSRRRFLQISAATLGAATAGRPWMPDAAFAATPTLGDVLTIPTLCDMCFWRCGAIAHVRDGKLWKFTGNPLDSQSEGRLCPRGTAAVGAAYDPDRLRQPLLRVGTRGQEQWKAVSWDEALGFIAARMNKIKAEQGPESVALFNHGLGERFFVHVLKSWGVVNMAEPAFAQCRGARDTGFNLTFGSGIPAPEPTDIRNTECLVLLGSHIGENMHNGQVREFAEAVARRVPVIVVDPRQSVAATKAKYWLPIKPGTDIALLLTWMNLLVTERRYDADFVEKFGHGFEQFKDEIKGYTPAWGAERTGLSAELIVAAAREFSSHRPATLIHPGRRSNWYGDDSQRARALALLTGLMGSWGRKGGIYVPTSMKVEDYPLPPYPSAGKAQADGSDGAQFKFADEGVTTSIRAATLNGKPYPIKSWVVYSTNLLQNLPDRAQTLAAIDKLDLLVVCDTIPSEIAGYADVVLPDTTFLERYDELVVGWGRRGWIGLRQPVLAAPHDQKPSWWIAKQLANKLGVGACMPFADMEAYLRWRVEKSGYSWETLKRDGIIMGKPSPVTVEEGLALDFDTPSHKVEFWSDQLAAAGFDAVPKYTEHPQPPAGQFRLITGRAPVHTFSKTQSNPYLHDLMPENEVWVNAGVARGLGIADRAYVRLKNQDGVLSNRVRVKATERIRDDCVYIAYGFGLTNKALHGAYLNGASAAQLNTRYATDPLMGATSIHANFVTLVKEA